MDVISLVLVTAAVLGVLLVVLAVIAVAVLLPPVRRRLAEQAKDAEDGYADADRDVAGVDPLLNSE